MLWALLLLAADPVTPLTVEAALRTAAPGTRIGLVVAREDGTEVIAVRPDERFVPASNTKLFSTALAFEHLPADTPDTAGAEVRLEGRDVALVGHGDARLSSAPDCATDCLAILADAVRARTRRVRDVIGDDTAFPDERWSPGMSWNNMPTRSGTAASALTLDDNETLLTVTAGSTGQPPATAGSGYYTVDNRALTVAEGRTDLAFDRTPGSRVLRLTGTILASAPPERLRLAVDDPAHHAAWRFAQLLRDRGVRVTGEVRVRHRPDTPSSAPALARLTPPPLAEDLTLTNKVSQNVHAELLLRRVAARTGSGSLADGQREVRAMLDRAGVEPWRVDLSDGSGMSSYNRVSPRGMVRFLRWTAAQRWGAALRQTLPVAGVDGTLARRFKDTPLQGRLQAKTGSLSGANALAGFLTAASGRTLVFAAYAADMPGDGSATAVLDRALVAVAAAN